MTAANVEDVYRLSPIQQGMLFHALAAGEAAAYLDQFVLHLESEEGRDYETDLGALARAWQRVAERHPVLRTSFFWEEVEEPVQLVHRNVELPIEHVDLSAETPEEARRLLAELVERDRDRGFALDRAPLMRLTAIRLGERSFRLLWSYHHLLLDGWSAEAVIQEVATISLAERRGAEIPLPTRRPFRDYITWLRQQDLGAAEVYWRRALSGLTAPTALGIDAAPGRAVAVDDRHAEIERPLGEALSAALQAFARQNRITLHTAVAGAWALALAHRAAGGGRDVLFGNTVSGRPPALAGSEAMIGCFINTLPVRVEAPPEAELLPWLRDLQTRQMEVRRFEYSPLVEIRRWSEIPAGQPLFEAILVFENYLTKGTDETRRFDSLQRTHFPLTLVVWPGREIRLKAGFYTGRFEPAAIDRLLEHMEALLRAFVAAPPGARLAGLPAAGPAEAAALAAWHRPRKVHPAGACLHERFAAQAARRPGAVAVTGADGLSLTYRELEERANQLAWFLRRLGVGPEVPVGLCTGRSPDLIAGLLGILKAGGAYVPLDPLYPAERLSFLAEDAGVRIVVTEDRFAAALPGGVAAGRVLVRFDGDAAALGREPRTPPPSGVLPGNLAYVIYTSGSTGRPKGSLISHANVVRLLDATADGFGLGEADVWTLFHSYAFDFSVWEIWGALAFGGRLAVVPHEVSRSPDAFRELLAREGVTVLNQTPSAFRQLTEADARWAGASGLALRLVVFGGEALDPAALAPWFDRHGDERPRLVNMYGITETTIHVTWHPLSQAEAARGASPIGVPVPDLWAALLEGGVDAVPLGVAGEVCVGGAGLARGYLRRPDLTAERFVPDPFGGERGEPGARLYRSGDLARRGADGGLEYLGRLDHQVKIRGFRIEPGEIEAELERHPGVRRAVVLPEGQGEERRLLAYLVATNGAPPAPAELREHLRPRLPDYMIPAGWVFVPELPLTAHGKVDLAALRRAGGASLAVAPYEAPQSALEETIAALWQDLLKVERVGVHDNFFDLGGHSILMIQVQRRLQDQLGRKLSMVDLLSHASVGSLARFLAGGGAGRPAGEAELVEVAERQAERAEEGKSRLLQMRRAGRPSSDGEAR